MTQAFWILLAAAVLFVGAIVGLKTIGQAPARPTVAIRGAWLVGATTSATLLIFIAAKVVDLQPKATAIDVGALAITGILTGLFLGLGLKPARENTVVG